MINPSTPLHVGQGSPHHDWLRQPGRSVLDWARLYVSDGISVIPIRPDGSKAPALYHWKLFQERLPTPAELEHWFQGGECGIAILAGRVSGNLEILDFDDRDTFLHWAQTRADLAARLPQVVTPSGGRHLYYRLPFPPLGNRKLAERRITDPLTGKKGRKVLIESRGEGGYVVAPGSPYACHVTLRPYQFVPDRALPPIPLLQGGIS
jgi:putative DNA primase/helicase